MSITPLQALLIDYCNYNVWANQRFHDLLIEVQKEKLTQEVNSSFPSILKTIYHIWDAETIWLNRMQGISLTRFPSKALDITPKEGLDQWLLHSKTFLQFVEEQPASFFEKNAQYSTTRGVEHQQKNTEIIQHCMNHSTYHRGQITTMCRQVGIEQISSTDYIAYLRIKG